MRAVQQFCPDCGKDTEHSNRWDKERHGELWTCLECGYQAVYRVSRAVRAQKAEDAFIAQGLPVQPQELSAYMAVSPDGEEVLP